MKKSSTRELFEERVKYLFGTNFNELNSDDRINLISIKIVLEPIEYCLLKRWGMNKWSYEKLSKEYGRTNTQIKQEISKVITKLKPFIWSYENSIFVKNRDKETSVKYISPSDRVIEDFLKTDSMIVSVDEYLDIVNKTL